MERQRQVLAALIAAMAVLAAACVVYTAVSGAHGKSLSLAEKRQQMRAAAREHNHRMLEELDSINFGATTIGNTGQEEGNLGAIWNYGAVRFTHKNRTECEPDR